jgi:hypothetical protein
MLLSIHEVALSTNISDELKREQMLIVAARDIQHVQFYYLEPVRRLIKHIFEGDSFITNPSQPHVAPLVKSKRQLSCFKHIGSRSLLVTAAAISPLAVSTLTCNFRHVRRLDQA